MLMDTAASHNYILGKILMSKEARESQRTMFVCAALFNFAAAFLLGIFQENVLPLLGMEPIANEAFLHLFLGLVFIFGLGYYRVSMNSEANRDIVWLGFWGKLLVVVLLIIHASQGNISWGLAALGLGDLLFAVLFVRFLAIRPVKVRN